MSKNTKVKQTLKWAFAGLPLGTVVWASFLSMADWAHQALVLIALLWFFVFYLLDCFYLAG